MNRLLRNQTHYESVRLLRNIDWSYLFLVACTVRTRLEVQMSFDPFLEPILERVSRLAETIDTASNKEWAADYDQKALGQEIVNILFTPPASDANSSFRVTCKQPERLDVREVFELVVSSDHSDSAGRTLQTLLCPSVRRLCLLQKSLAGKWITAVEKANWWRICAELKGAPQPIDQVRAETVRAMNHLSGVLIGFVDTYSYSVDNTDDHDDYEVRCEVARQTFFIDQTSFSRSIENAQDRLYRFMRAKEESMAFSME